MNPAQLDLVRRYSKLLRQQTASLRSQPAGARKRLVRPVTNAVTAATAGTGPGDRLTGHNASGGR